MYSQLTEAGIGVDTLVTILCQEKYNAHGQQMNFLGPVLSNLSQLPEVRKHILDRGRCVIQRLVAFTEYGKSVVKRGGVVGTVYKWIMEFVSCRMFLAPTGVLERQCCAGHYAF